MTDRNNGTVKIVTPTHGIALSMYLISAAQGIVHLVGIATAASLTELSSTWFADVWGVLFFTGGIVAFTAARRRHYHPDRVKEALKKELVGVTLIAFCNFMYELALVSVLGWGSVPQTQLYAGGILLACVWRSAQIVRELLAIRGASSSTAT